MKQRKCLKCNNLFDSESFKNRICFSCNLKNKKLKLGNQNKHIHSMSHGRVVLPLLNSFQEEEKTL